MGLLRIIRIMRISTVTYICKVIRAFTFIAFVCVADATMTIISLNQYVKEREAPSECHGRLGVCK